MFISIARKLQAVQDLLFPTALGDRAGGAPARARARDRLAGRAIKKGDKRAAAWKAAFGVEQTELDALTTPEMTERGIVRELIEDAFAPYVDRAWPQGRRAAPSGTPGPDGARRQIDSGAIARPQGEVEACGIGPEISMVNSYAIE